MDQGIVTTTAGRYVRLALIFFVSVLGLILLGFVFGSSSASADEGGPDDSGLVPAAADLAGGVVETVAPVTTQLAAEAIPLADVPLSPAASSLATVKVIAKTLDATIDTAVGTLAAVVAPVLNELPAVFAATVSAQDATASTAPAAGDPISGAANGLWPGASDPFGTVSIASAASAAGTALSAAAIGAGFLVLLFSPRFGLVNSTLPVSPVYETDTSPD